MIIDLRGLRYWIHLDSGEFGGCDNALGSLLLKLLLSSYCGVGAD